MWKQRRGRGRAKAVGGTPEAVASATSTDHLRGPAGSAAAAAGTPAANPAERAAQTSLEDKLHGTMAQVMRAPPRALQTLDTATRSTAVAVRAERLFNPPALRTFRPPATQNMSGGQMVRWASVSPSGGSLNVLLARKLLCLTRWCALLSGGRRSALYTAGFL